MTSLPAQALVLDCDGVLADTERYGHLVAFNQTFEEFGLPVRWSVADYQQKVRIGGGKERMASLLTPEFVAAAGLPPVPKGSAAPSPPGTAARRRSTPNWSRPAPPRPGRASPASWPRRWLRAGRWPSRRRQPNPPYA